MSARFEIVQTNAEQAWHARLIVAGKRVWWTENYARKVGAERAVRSNGRALAAMFSVLLTEYAEDVFWRTDSPFSSSSRHSYIEAGKKLDDLAEHLPVVYLDERTAP